MQNYVKFEKLDSYQKNQVIAKWHPLDETLPPAAYAYSVGLGGEVLDRTVLDPAQAEIDELRRLATVTPDETLRKGYAVKLEDALQKASKSMVVVVHSDVNEDQDDEEGYRQGTKNITSRKTIQTLAEAVAEMQRVSQEDEFGDRLTYAEILFGGRVVAHVAPNGIIFRGPMGENVGGTLDPALTAADLEFYYGAAGTGDVAKALDANGAEMLRQIREQMPNPFSTNKNYPVTITINGRTLHFDVYRKSGNSSVYYLSTTGQTNIVSPNGDVLQSSPSMRLYALSPNGSLKDNGSNHITQQQKDDWERAHGITPKPPVPTTQRFMGDEAEKMAKGQKPSVDYAEILMQWIKQKKYDDMLPDPEGGNEYLLARKVQGDPEAGGGFIVALDEAGDLLNIESFGTAAEAKSKFAELKREASTGKMAKAEPVSFSDAEGVGLGGEVLDRTVLDPAQAEIDELRRLATVTPDETLRKQYEVKLAEAMQKMLARVTRISDGEFTFTGHGEQDQHFRLSDEQESDLLGWLFNHGSTDYGAGLATWTVNLQPALNQIRSYKPVWYEKAQGGDVAKAEPVSFSDTEQVGRIGQIDRGALADLLDVDFAYISSKELAAFFNFVSRELHHSRREPVTAITAQEWKRIEAALNLFKAEGGDIAKAEIYEVWSNAPELPLDSAAFNRRVSKRLHR